MKIFPFAICVLASLYSFNLKANDNLPSIFVTHELNGDSSITSVGAGMTFKDNHSNFGANISMSLGNAEIVTNKLRVEDYLAWELGAKVGYFSDISLYLEAGVDLGELFGREHHDDDHFHDNSFNLFDDHYDDHHSHYHDDHYSNRTDSLDAYIGVGGGINFGHVQLSGQVRFRQIDSEEWKSLDDVYTGVTLTMSF